MKPHFLHVMEHEHGDVFIWIGKSRKNTLNEYAVTAFPKKKMKESRKKKTSRNVLILFFVICNTTVRSKSGLDNDDRILKIMPHHSNHACHAHLVLNFLVQVMEVWISSIYMPLLRIASFIMFCHWHCIDAIRLSPVINHTCKQKVYWQDWRHNSTWKHAVQLIHLSTTQCH